MVSLAIIPCQGTYRSLGSGEGENRKNHACGQKEINKFIYFCWAVYKSRVQMCAGDAIDGTCYSSNRVVRKTDVLLGLLHVSVIIKEL